MEVIQNSHFPAFPSLPLSLSLSLSLSPPLSFSLPLSFKELDLVAFQFHNFEKVFASHLTLTSVTLLGRPVAQDNDGVQRQLLSSAVVAPATPIPQKQKQQQQHLYNKNSMLSKLTLDFPRTPVHQTAGSATKSCL